MLRACVSLAKQAQPTLSTCGLGPFKLVENLHMSAAKTFGVSGPWCSPFDMLSKMHYGGAASTPTDGGAFSSSVPHKVAPHAGLKNDDYLLMHPVYTSEYVESVKPSHIPPTKLFQKAGYGTVNLARSVFDRCTGYGPNMTEAKWLQRMIFLETVAGVPGMVAGMLRHMKSLRSFKRDHGWIHTLLEEAENERMHLLTFLQLRKPGPLFRAMVILAQGVAFNAYMMCYLLSPKTCHAFVGYLEEEAVKTYTHALKDIDEGKIWKDTLAPRIAVDYWKLGEGATMRDLILAVRADEACHAHVNHTFSTLPPEQENPFKVGSHMVP